MTRFQWKLFLCSLLLVAGVFSAGTVSAQTSENGTVLIEVLERKDCEHCQAELQYLSILKKERSDIIVKTYDIDTPEGKQLFETVVSRAKLTKATPITIVGSTIFQGFDTPETTGPHIEFLLNENRNTLDQGFARFLESGTIGSVGKSEGLACTTDGDVCKPVEEPILVKIPLLGTINIRSWSLPALATVLGFLDGFNPCAMWVLVTFLIALMQTGSRRRMLQIAGLFLLAETLQYYLILNVWFKVWDFVGMDRIITPVVGILSVGSGLFFLYEWYKSLGTEMACRVVDMEERSKIIRKIRSFSTSKLTIATAIGIVALALSVNIIEFACSIGYPQTFTKIIELNGLGFWQTQLLMALYIFFYMVDDLVVFGLALWGFDRIHMTESFSRWSALIGGALMLVLGWMLIFYPEILRAF